MSDEFDDMIHDAFANGDSEAAPEMAWNRIDDELNKITELDEKIKQSFEAVHENAPDFIWEKVQDQLDIDKVWKAISIKLIHRVKRTYIGYACAVLFLLLPFLLDHSYMPTFNQSGTASTSPTITSDLTSAKTQTEVEKNVTAVDRTKNARIEALVYNRTDGNSELTHSATDDDMNRAGIKSENTYLRTDGLALNSVSLLALESTPDVANWKAPINPGIKRKWIAGLTASLDHSWIIDQDTRAGFNDESLVENRFSIGNSTGVFVEFPIKGQFAFHGEYLFQSATRQANQTFINGTYTLKEKEINAQRLVLLASYNSQIKHNWLSHSNVVRFGTFVSLITGNSIEHNGNLVESNSLTNQFDIGIQSEVGKRIYLGSFLIEGGLRGDFGFLNLSSPQSDIPKHLNFTREASIGTYLKVGYHF
jgi:hypothetical protein